MMRCEVAVGDGAGTPSGPDTLLDEEDQIAFGIADTEDAMFQGLDDGDGVGFEVALECGGVAGGEGDRFLRVAGGGVGRGLLQATANR